MTGFEDTTTTIKVSDGNVSVREADVILQK